MTTINNTFNYNDLASLNAITQMGEKDEAAALKQVSRQFESMFVTMMLKSMRDANAVFEEDNPLNSNESKFYRQMFDDQLALSMTEGRGIGLGDSIYRQLMNQFDVEKNDDADKPSQGIPIGDYRGPNPPVSMKPNLNLPQFSIEEIADPINLPKEVNGIQISPEVMRRVHNKEVNRAEAAQEAINPAKVTPEPLTVIPTFIRPEAIVPVSMVPVSMVPVSMVPASTSSNIQDKAVNQGPVSKQSGFNTPEQFVKTLWPIAQQVGKEMGVEPKAIISQAALETGWGKYIIHESNGKNSHNLFGIKSDSRWDGAAANVSTLEFRNGVATKEVAAFRSYDSYEHSLKDYASFVQNSSRYEEAVKNGSSTKGYSEGLQKGGYATDPNYAKKIQGIASGEMLNGILGNQADSQAAKQPSLAMGRG
jgi:flagellar protein FlgJ